MVIDFPLLDTRNKVNGITGKFIADMVLQVMSYIAQIERENTLIRQAEGIKEAQKKGIKFGRPKRDRPENFDEVYMLWTSNCISKREAARRLLAVHSTFSRWVEESPPDEIEELEEQIRIAQKNRMFEFYNR